MSLSYNRKNSYRHAKLANPLEEIRLKIELEQYLDTRHAMNRQLQRKITQPDILYTLRHGYHEKRKDRYDDQHQTWNYAVRGKTIDKREIRVIVSFDEGILLIITAMKIGNSHEQPEDN